MSATIEGDSHRRCVRLLAPKISIIVPTKDEQDAIAGVVRDFRNRAGTDHRCGHVRRVSQNHFEIADRDVSEVGL
jgi:hypothetical protein